MPHSITCIIGPTASGKSALALALAEQTGAEILCVDSMTVYRGLDIGTAKPSTAERERVKHHLLDVVDPTVAFTVAEFVTLADAAIENAKSRDVPLIAVGGTPMYFKALFEGLFEGPGADDAVRTELDAWSTEALLAEVARIDPAAATRIDRNDRRRMIRAIEVHRLTGKAISDHQQEWGQQVRHPARWLGLNWQKEALNRRINIRVRQMMNDGWPTEVRDLLAKHGPLSRTAGAATGYAQLTKFLAGEMPYDDANEATKVATRQLASRQMKWFRRFANVSWIDGELPAAEQLAAAK